MRPLDAPACALIEMDGTTRIPLEGVYAGRVKGQHVWVYMAPASAGLPGESLRLRVDELPAHTTIRIEVHP